MQHEVHLLLTQDEVHAGVGVADQTASESQPTGWSSLAVSASNANVNQAAVKDSAGAMLAVSYPDDLIGTPGKQSVLISISSIR